jgi:hypothetical protein
MALIAAGLDAKDIVTVLSNTIDIPPSQQDICNLVNRTQTLELDGNTSINTLNYILDE